MKPFRPDIDPPIRSNVGNPHLESMKKMGKQSKVIVLPEPIPDAESRLSTLYRRLGEIQAAKLEFALLPPVSRSAYSTLFGELLVDEYRLVIEAEQLQASIAKMVTPRSSAAVIDFTSR